MNMKYALRSEDTEQITVMNWARYQVNAHPELKLFHHIPNGGSRNKAEAIKLKQMGVRAGVPDLHLPVPKGIYAGLYIEMKYNRGRLEPSQKKFLNEAAENGNYCAVCYGAEAAIRCISEYIRLKPGSGMKTPNPCILKEGKVKAI